MCTFTEIPVSKSSSTENYEIIRHKPTFYVIIEIFLVLSNNRPLQDNFGTALLKGE